MNPVNVCERSVYFIIMTYAFPIFHVFLLYSMCAGSKTQQYLNDLAIYRPVATKVTHNYKMSR